MEMEEYQACLECLLNEYTSLNKMNETLEKMESETMYRYAHIQTQILIAKELKLIRECMEKNARLA